MFGLFTKKKEAPIKASDDPSSIGNVLVTIGKVTQEQLTNALQQQAAAADVRLGAILKDSGIVDAADIAKAMEIQEKMRKGHTAAADMAALEMEVEKSKRGAQQLTQVIEDRRQMMRDVGEKSDIFMLPLVANGGG
jgi:hypothetical protein